MQMVAISTLWSREQTFMIPGYWRCSRGQRGRTTAADRGGTTTPALDKPYGNPSGRGTAAGHCSQAHIGRIGEEKLDASGKKRYPERKTE